MLKIRMKYNFILDMALFCLLFSSLILQGSMTYHKMLFLPVSVFLLLECIYAKRSTYMPKRLVILWIPVMIGIYSAVFISDDPFFNFWKIAEQSTLPIVAMAYGEYQRKKRQSIFEDRYYNIALKFLKLIVIYCFIISILLPQHNILTAKQSYSMSKALLPYLLNVSTGISLNANSLGCIAAIAAYDEFYRFFFYHTETKMNCGKVMLWISIGFCLIFAQSRTSWIALSLAAGITLFIYAGKRKKARWILIAVTFVVLGNWNTIFAYILRGRSSEELTNMSGRMDYWPIVLNQINEGGIQSFFLGLGFGTAVKAKYGAYQLASLHSDFFDSLANMGWIGALCYLFYFADNILYGGWNMIKSLLQNCRCAVPENMYKLGIILIISVRSLTGSTIFSFGQFSLLLILMLCNTVKRNRAEMQGEK